jgi:hypothetical protein
MLVYGDRRRTQRPRTILRALTASLRAAEAAPHGLARHDLLTSAFVEAAGLAQGLADAEFEAKGFDEPTPAHDTAMALLLALARKLAASWASGFAAAGPPVAPELMALALMGLPETVSIRTPEGYAFYALYPEAYLKAAASHPWRTPPLVIGLRSIGLGLAALVGAVTNARTIISLRPSGDPFRRELRISEGLRNALAAHDGPFAIVDEGPGLSGSSFGAVADLLEDLGVAAERIVFLPGHAGDLGPQASDRHRERWACAVRPTASFADLTADVPLEDWFTDLTGPISAAEDLSGGAWRGALPPQAWPPVHAGQERLKFRLHTASGVWLAKFAGLGDIGEQKLARAQALHKAGYTPEPLALRRGFLLERWEPGAPGALGDRQAVVDHLARYLGFRAAAFPAEAEEGADLTALVEMARVNVGERLGAETGQAIAARLAIHDLTQIQARAVHVDGRLHAWEWLRTPDGLLLKTDAVDHSEAHDLVGCQDIAWDIAGAVTEFNLDAEETARLCERIEAVAGRRLDPALLQIMKVCYPAFQAGLWRFAEDAASDEERPRIATHAARYAGRLADLAASVESPD